MNKLATIVISLFACIPIVCFAFDEYNPSDSYKFGKWLCASQHLIQCTKDPDGCQPGSYTGITNEFWWDTGMSPLCGKPAPKPSGPCVIQLKEDQTVVFNQTYMIQYNPSMCQDQGTIYFQLLPEPGRCISTTPRGPSGVPAALVGPARTPDGKVCGCSGFNWVYYHEGGEIVVLCDSLQGNDETPR